MATTNVSRKEKPLIPPKPTHLGRSARLPKPPEKVINSFEEYPVTSKKNEQDRISGNDLGIHDLQSAPPTELQAHHDHLPSEEMKKTAKNEDPELSVSDVTSKAQRPLPQLPNETIEKVEFARFPWFMPVDRRKAEELVSNGIDGHCLVRPSSKGTYTLALTLWYSGRAYNIPIRKKSDGRFALGSERAMEETFSTVENMITAYQREELTLYSGGVETGKTKLIPIRL